MFKTYDLAKLFFHLCVDMWTVTIVLQYFTVLADLLLYWALYPLNN